MAWIHSVCLVAMTYITWHGSFHVGIYTLIHLYYDYGNSYLSDDILLYCISLFVVRFSINVFLVPYTHSTKYFIDHSFITSYIGGLSVTHYFHLPYDRQ
jgi:hypothetical protein